MLQIAENKKRIKGRRWASSHIGYDFKVTTLTRQQSHIDWVTIHLRLECSSLKLENERKKERRQKNCNSIRCWLFSVILPRIPRSRLPKELFWWRIWVMLFSRAVLYVESTHETELKQQAQSSCCKMNVLERFSVTIWEPVAKQPCSSGKI